MLMDPEGGRRNCFAGFFRGGGGISMVVMMMMEP